MTPERWQKLQIIFEAALENADRPTVDVVAELCPGDPNLAAEALELIDAHRTAGDSFQPPARLIPDPANTLQAGAVIAGRYRIVGLLGRGGMGEVYEAEDTLIGEHVALKFVLTGLNLPDAVARLTRELKTARRVTHPNVCRVHDIVIEEHEGNQRVFYTMELLHGEVLSNRIQREGALAPALRHKLARQIAAGLDAIHAAGIVHRDLKTSNIFLEQSGGAVRAVITDFGLARALATDKPTALLGTLEYVAPELLQGAQPSPATDIYALGVVLYAMATSRTPLNSLPTFHAALERLRKSAPALGASNLGLDEAWEAAIFGCLKSDPAKRLKSGAEVVAVLDGAPIVPPTRRVRHAKVFAFAAAALMMAIALWALWQSRYYKPPTQAALWFDRAMLARNSGDYFTAAKQFEQAITIDDNFALAHAMLADCFAAQDYGVRAREEMLRANARAGATVISEPDRQRIQAIELLLLREYREAASRYESLAAGVPASAGAGVYMDLARTLEQSEQTRAAITVYRRVADANPADAASRVRLGVLLARTGESQTAEASFSRAMQIYEAGGNLTGLAEAALHRSRALLLTSRVDESDKLLRRAMDVATAAQSPWLRIRVLLQEGVAARRKGDVAAARQYATEAVQLARQHDMDYASTAGMLDLGNTFLQYREYDDAEKWFQSALDVARGRKDQRNEARALASLASLRLAQHRPKDAAGFITPALDYYTRGNYRRETATVLLLGALAREQAGDIDAAEEFLKRNVVLATAEAVDQQQVREAHSRLAALQIRREDYAAALESYKAAEAIPVKKVDGLLLVNKALAQWHLGLVQEAEQSVAQAAKVSETQKQIRARMRWVTAAMRLRAGKPPAAIAELEASLKELPETAEAERMEATALLGLAKLRSGNSNGWGLCEKAATWADSSTDAHIIATLHLIAAHASLLAGRRDRARAHASASLKAAEQLHRSETAWRACYLATPPNNLTRCDDFTKHLKLSWGDAHFLAVAQMAPPGDVSRF